MFRKGVHSETLFTSSWPTEATISESALPIRFVLVGTLLHISGTHTAVFRWFDVINGITSCKNRILAVEMNECSLLIDLDFVKRSLQLSAHWSFELVILHFKWRIMLAALWVLRLETSGNLSLLLLYSSSAIFYYNKVISSSLKRPWCPPTALPSSLFFQPV